MCDILTITPNDEAVRQIAFIVIPPREQPMFVLFLDNPDEHGWNNHYNEVIDRTVFEVLTKQYDRWQRPEISIAFLSYVDNNFGTYTNDGNNYDFNPYYSTYAFEQMNAKNARTVEKYLAFIKEQHKAPCGKGFRQCELQSFALPLPFW